jgi:glycosyltransferase involved in cell wall biosynthesis
MTIVCVSGFTLTSERGTPCHLMRAMAKRVPVIYINPPHSYARARQQPSTDGEGLQVITPTLPTTFRFLPRRWRRWLVSLLSAPQVVRRVAPNLHPPVVLWSYLSELTLPLQRALKAEILCYHRLDDFAILSPKDRPLERAIEVKADLLFVVSMPLQEQYARQGRKAILLPNGVDLAHFSQALNEKTEVPKDLASLPSPRIGYVGIVDPLWWVDMELLIGLARVRPDWSVVLIGPTEKRRLSFNVPSNLHLLGARPYRSVPCYLKGMDVCLVPFKKNAVTQACSPLKLYEYLAAGRAVVSTPVPDLAFLSSVVRSARSQDEFLAAIEEVLPLAHDPREQQRRLEVAAQHSWQQRAQVALAWIEKALTASKTRHLGLKNR